MSSVFIEADKTFRSVHAGRNRISWSKLQQYEHCPGKWLIENHAALVDPADRLIDDLHALPGTLVQRLWTAIINDRLYRREGLRDRAALSEWARQQVAALFACIARPLEDQHRLPKEHWRRYFSSDEGKPELHALADRHGLHPSLRHHLQPKFLRFERLFELHGGRDPFLEKLAATFVPTINMLDGAGYDLDEMLAEVFVISRNAADGLAGGIDFIWNRRRSANGFFDDPALLEDGYVLLDGKMQLGPTVDSGQLRFYATMLRLNYNKTPSRLGFLSYRPTRLVLEDFREVMITGLLARISRYHAGLAAVSNGLEAYTATANMPATLPMAAIPGLRLTPGRIACRFCGIASGCSVSKVRQLA